MLAEGPRWEIVVSPGVFRVRTRDYARAERTHERAIERHRKNVDVAAAWDGDLPEPLRTRGTIVAWTRKSRTRLVERLSDLDYTRLYGRFHICDGCGEEYDEHFDRCSACRSASRTTEDRRGRLPAMLTLTYPGDWLTVAPDAQRVTMHFQALCKRYERAWGEPLRGPWKKEFQGRGARHSTSRPRRRWARRPFPIRRPDSRSASTSSAGSRSRGPTSWPTPTRSSAAATSRLGPASTRAGHQADRPAAHGGLLRQVRRGRDGQGVSAPGAVRVADHRPRLHKPAEQAMTRTSTSARTAAALMPT